MSFKERGINGKKKSHAVLEGVDWLLVKFAEGKKRDSEWGSRWKTQRKEGGGELFTHRGRRALKQIKLKQEFGGKLLHVRGG